VNRRIVVYARARSPGARFTGDRSPAITGAMNDHPSIVPRDGPPRTSGETAVAERPAAPRLVCPLGRATRLIPVSLRNGLVECRPAQAGHCPNFMSFGGGFFCRAHLGLTGAHGPRQP
jgi:hypothetical protein